MKVMTIIGARPQFIKAAVVSQAFADDKRNVEEVIVHTGQHYDTNMSDIFFGELNIPIPNYNLGIGGGTHGQNTGRMLERIEWLMLEEKPDWVLVYGDTDSTLAAALAASKINIPVAHVEAGLRSFNRRMPEEINRILTDNISYLHFVPTQSAEINLLSEGMSENTIIKTGDVMFDASLVYRDNAQKPDWFQKKNFNHNNYILCTIHRQLNTESFQNLNSILNGIASFGIPVVVPLHPRTKKKIEEYNIKIPKNIFLFDPVGYLEMIWLEINALFIATDSGGIQKEAYFYGKRCVVLRDDTEWVELIDSGWNYLAGASVKKISSFDPYKIIKKDEFIYGKGDASKKITEALFERK